MCGVAGFWSDRSISSDQARQVVERMAQPLVQRGPDAAGVYFDADTGVALGHRRLAIVDLSVRGQQPMWSHNGRYCISYNGEVYNAPELRAELERDHSGLSWRGHSDTETMLEAIAYWGLSAALKRFIGMFAFALWDKQERALYLGRDRLGIKPLCYVRGAFGIAFGSELKALLQVPWFDARLNRACVAEFLRYGVVPGQWSIIENVTKVPPGTLLRFQAATAEPKEQRFWSAQTVAQQGVDDRFVGSADEAIDELDVLLNTAVSMRMRSDVAFGAFLSGGIDSSVVVALMQNNASRPIHTFCIGNEDPRYDESPNAREIADHIGCEHRSLVVRAEDMQAQVPGLAAYWDEPFADSSQLPTYMVSSLARQHVIVALSGDGGDELFGGYNRHIWAPRLWSWAGRMPRFVRKRLSMLTKIGVDRWDALFAALGQSNRLRLPGDKVHKLATLAEASSASGFYERLRCQWYDPRAVLIDDGSLSSSEFIGESASLSFAEQMMLSDLVKYLPDDILTKVDRASMAVSLEARVPLLDHRIVEFVARLPLDWKIKGSTGKWILRQVLARYVSPRLFERPKMGFGVPIGAWLRTSLKPWAASLLDTSSLAQQGIFKPEAIEAMWHAHQSGQRIHEQRLWSLLMFQDWWQNNRHQVAA